MTTFGEQHAIRVGPAGWSYQDWEGIVYPPHGSKFDHLAYLARSFDTIEVNSTFYRIPPPTHGRSWARRVAFNDRFRFTVKLFRGFTHEPESVGQGDVDAFRAALDPLAEAGRLGAVLVQFPWRFKEKNEDDRVEAERRLHSLFGWFQDYPLALEVRHGSFQRDEFFRFLDAEGVGFVNIDQPVFGDSVRPSAVATGGVGYIRLHGRNYEKWFAHEESWERYDYLYTPEQLEPWVGRARELATARDVYVITNNHFRGQAIVNAIDLKRGLGQPVEVPAPLASHYGARISG